MRLVHLPMDTASMVLAVAETGVEVAYFGAPIGEGSLDDLRHGFDRPVPEGGLDQLAPIGILAQASLGFAAVPGISGRRDDGGGWAPRMAEHTITVDDGRAVIAAADVRSGLEERLEVHADPATSVVQITATITNTAATAYNLDGVAASIAVPSDHTEVLVLGGRWSNEFRPERHPWNSGTIAVENRRGRTSHDRLPFMATGAQGFTEETGRVIAAHLGWSGNVQLRAEVLRDGRRILQAGELLLPGEVRLEAGETYQMPTLYLATSDRGMNGISAAFHRHLRARDSHPTSARPVILNTWEAVYFDQDLETLSDLADRAASVGVERFVLDDGWFHGRRHDRAGLGDWWVDSSVWPQGLKPLVDHVVGLGMEFGLWVEPEMVNPDSDLYRSHPDWALVDPESDPVLFRNQLPLDLANPEVFAYLFGHLDRLLADYEISYLKWDMNRDLVAPQHDGRSTVRLQVEALYRLIDQLREAHPGVEIESCSSGGARADFGVLERTDRVWASDCNDALDRQRIQRGFSYLFPPEVMGAHIGPPQAHTTGRQHSLSFRAATAFFGHLGIEWNLRCADDAELKALAQVITLHKRLRPLLHSGEIHRLDPPSPAILAHAVVADDRSEAVVSAAQVATSDALAVGPLRISGLDPARRYEVSLVSLAEDAPPGKAKRQPAWVLDGSATMGGQHLATVGLQLPVLHPESAVVLHLTEVR